ncbi:DUF6904 family protein [Mucilaginibacter sp. E4BP6]|uniref:DUF6904 family protein n=1 Tax=Mucilaginibacter sp. E4BP6 TaxID=2723089 RepID=UPI0015C92288|nr:hypothetical protein [Mucilaginibacter sp. E4BP6]NYE65267.1 hypothetical protein [Mucilaginibacter sp. E4BP6]
MLQIYPTKKGTGVQILGDYADLRTLYSTIHKLAERLDPEGERTKGKSELLMALAYEIRKAYSGQRYDEVLTLDGHFKVTYQGFNFLWSDLIIAFNVLRNEAGYLATEPLDQSCLYLLEAQLRNALTSFDAKDGLYLQEFIGKWINISHPYVYLISQAIALDYLRLNPGKGRFRKIADLFHNYFDENSKEYKDMLRGLENSAAEKECKILNLEFGGFPEIKW